MNISIVPETAPFNAEQRAWLNGFFAGLTGLQASSLPASSSPQLAALQSIAAGVLPAPAGTGSTSFQETESAPIEAEEDFPWHDPALGLDQRLSLAADRPLPRKLMAAMAQLNCGACGYLCQTYSEAIANGSEANLKLCSPGGAETAKVLKQLLKEQPAPTGSAAPVPAKNGTVNGPAAAASHGPAAPKFTRTNPLPARLVSTTNLNRPGSEKQTSHVVLDLGESGLTYEVGDSLGVFPRNCPEYVQAIIRTFQADPQLPVTNANEQPLTLTELLLSSNLRDVDERQLTLLEDFASADQLQQLRALAKDDARLATMDLLDLCEMFASLPLDWERFATVLQPLRPRLYSIASSPAVYPNQVHLTIAKATKLVGNRLRKGVASTMFSDRAKPGDLIPVFVQPSHGFKLPADPSTPIIMVGPGTGIAPFRAFVQQRQACGAKGAAWLFFGDQKGGTDFLYQEEWEAHLTAGTLTRVDTAFSRDQEEKIYVQHRLREHGAELFQWLERGAYFYVCGDAQRMALDVDRALQEVVAQFGKRTAKQAQAYVTQLSQSKRYLRDVY